MDLKVEGFYAGVVACVQLMQRDSENDHIDLMLPDLIENYAPAGATLEGLIEAIRESDDGHVMQVFVVKEWEDYGDGESGPMVRGWELLRIVDLQANITEPESFMMADARVKELHKGEVK